MPFYSILRRFRKASNIEHRRLCIGWPGDWLPVYLKRKRFLPPTFLSFRIPDISHRFYGSTVAEAGFSVLLLLLLLSYLYFLPPLLKDPSKFKKISILSIILSGLFIFICVATLLFMFSIYISTDEIMPLFSVSRYIEFGNFFQRFESLFLLIWTIAFCCYLSISFKFSTYIFKKIFNLKDSSQLIYTFALLMFILALLPKNYSICSFFEIYIYRYISIAIIILGIVLLLLSNLKKKKKVGD